LESEQKKWKTCLLDVELNEIEFDERTWLDGWMLEWRIGAIWKGIEGREREERQEEELSPVLMYVIDP